MNESTVVLSTYNWKEALELVLISLLRQTVQPSEIIIADDGSTDDTRQLIDQIRTTTKIPIIHVWHEDVGNRKSMVMNKAIAKATTAYILCMDGDVIAHPMWVEDHLSMAEKGMYLYGSRVNIQASLLDSLFKNKKVNFNFFSPGIKKRARTIHSRFLAKREKPHTNYSSKMRGCNFSFWKEDFIRVNGYNEDFTGWGREDSDLAYRFHHAGLRAKRLKFCAIVYHIYHSEQSKEFFQKNNELQENTIREKISVIKKGIDQYL